LEFFCVGVNRVVSTFFVRRLKSQQKAGIVQKETKLTMNKETDNRETAAEELAVIIRQRTFNLMSTGRLHHDFKSRFGSTCCRMLIKNGSSEFPHHFEACCDRGGWAAEHVARMILAERPELVPLADQAFLRRKDSRIAVMLKKIFPAFWRCFIINDEHYRMVTQSV